MTTEIKNFKKSWLLVCFALFAFVSSYSQTHLTYTITNFTSTANTLSYDVYITNDGTTQVKLANLVVGINYNAGILNGSTNPASNTNYTYEANSRSAGLNGLNPYGSIFHQYSATKNHLRFQTNAPAILDAAPVLTNGVAYKVGRFTFANAGGVNWTSASNAMLAFQGAAVAGYATTQATVYVDGTNPTYGVGANMAFVYTNAPYLLNNCTSTSSSQSATACDSYTWAANNTTYTQGGTYTSVTNLAGGCTDTKTLNLTITPSSINTTTVSACDSYTWNGTTYTASGLYTGATANCVTQKLDLTINSSTTSSQSVVACNSYTWTAGTGAMYTESGTYTFTGTNHSGCPLTKTLVLTINNSANTEDFVTRCDSYTWPVNGVTYTASGDFTFDSTNGTTGCQDGHTLHLIINNGVPTNETQVACNSYTWPVNGVTYTQSGEYVANTSSSGCSSTATLHLTINSTVITTQPASTYICSALGSTASVSVATTALNASYVWQYRVVTTALSNPDWITIDATNAGTVYSNYTTASLGITRLTTALPKAGTQYRVIVTADCGSATSDAAGILILSTLKAGSIKTPAASVCTGNDMTLTLSGYAGSSFQWYSCPLYTTAAGGTFTLIPGATGTTYTITNASADTPKSYRVEVFNTCNGATALSAIKTIKVDPPSVGGSVVGGGTVCSSGGSGTLAVSGNVGKIQWEYSLDGGATYADAPNAATAGTVSGFSTTSVNSTSAKYLVTNITVPVLFRARITSGTCSSAYSTVASFVLSGSATAGIVSAATTTALCPATGTSVTLTGGVGTITWYKSTTYTSASPVWTALTLHTATINTGNLAASTAYYAVTSIGGNCDTAPSNVVVVSVKAKPVAKTIAASPSLPTGAAATSAICTNSSIVKVLTIGTGYSGNIQWQRSTDLGVTYNDIAGETSQSYTITNPVVGANYYRAKFSNGCTEVIGATKIVYYNDCGNVGGNAEGGTVIKAVVKSSFAVAAYPNPYSENFNLSLTTTSEDSVGVVIYDMTGRLIDQREVKADEVSTLQIGDRYPSGVYNVIVTQGSEVKTLRVVKR